MAKKRRAFTAAFKAKVALAAIRGEGTLAGGKIPRYNLHKGKLGNSTVPTYFLKRFLTLKLLFMGLHKAANFPISAVESYASRVRWIETTGEL